MKTVPNWKLYLLVLVVALALVPCASAFAADKLVATVIALRGTVALERYGSQSDRELSLQDDLYQGDIVKTGDSGGAEILFLDGSQLKLDSNSAVRISTTALSVHNQNLFQALIGIIWAHVRPGQIIEAPSANIVVRGTEVALAISGDGTTQLTVVAGDVLFFNDKGTVEVTGNEQSVAILGQAPTTPVAVDDTGLISWTADVMGMPLVFDTPSTSRGDILRRDGDTAGAMAAYSSALQVNPNDVDASIGSSLTKLSQGNFDGARASLIPISSIPTAIAIGGLIDMEEGHPSRAQSEFRAALAADPSISSADSLLALTYLQQGDLVAAESLARIAVKLTPRSAEAQGSLSTILFFDNRTREASAAARAAVAADSESPFALLADGRSNALAGRYERARADFEKALAFAPYLWLIHQELAEVYEQLGDPRKASEEFRIALKLDATDADAYAGLGKSLQDSGQYKAAEDSFKSAVTTDPTNAAARYYYASFLIDRGRLSEAVSQINSVIGTNDSFGLLYARLAEIYLYKQDVFSANEYALRAVKILPESALAHYELGRVELEEEHTYQAESEFRIATVLDKRLATARYALGLVEEKTQSDLLSTFSSIFDSAYVGSPASSKNLNDLNTAGANERVQAAVEDPTAVRAATRSYGNTELDALGGNAGSDDLAGSYLSETASNTGVAGVDAQTQFTRGPLPNDDYVLNSGSLVVGRKAENEPVGYVLLGDYEQNDGGADNGLSTQATQTTIRYNEQLARVTAGVRIDTGGQSNILAIFQGIDELYGLRDSAPTSQAGYATMHIGTDSLDGEIRWELDPVSDNAFTVGMSYGDRHRSIDAFDNAGPFSLQQTLFPHLTPLQAYLRDDISTGGNWSFVAQLQYLQELPYSENDTVSPFVSDSVTRYGTTQVLPYFVAAYMPDDSTVIRLRFTRTIIPIEDFDLLTPTDDFLLDYVDLPQSESPFTDPISGESSTELEIDNSEPHGAFLSVGLYRNDLQNAITEVNAGPGPFGTVREQGVQASYQSLISKYVSYFVLGEFSNVEDESIPQRVGLTPNFVGVGTLQYLDRAGQYGQIAYYYQGDRQDESGDGTDLGAFGVLDLRVGHRFGLRSNVFAELNNALDKQYDDFGYLQHGSEVRLGITQRY